MRAFITPLFIFYLFHFPFSGYTQVTTTETTCDDTLWKHVYNSMRLKVLQKCITVTGVVKSVKLKGDGDAHILVKLDAGREKLLTQANYRDADSCMIVEVIYAIDAWKFDAKQFRKKYVNKVYVPKLGEHIEAIGNLVIDSHHDWAEIHPALKITVIND